MCWSSRGIALALLPSAIVAACGSDTPVNPDPPPVVTDVDSGASQPPGTDAAAPPADAGGVESFDPTGQSGTRLRRRYLEAGPGAFQTLRFWDSELEVACAFAEAPDGQLRCLPDTQTLSSVYFEDAACSKPIMDPHGPCGRRLGGLHAGAVSYYLPTDTKTPSISVIYLKRDDGGCEAVATTPRQLLVARELPSARFVLGTPKDEPRADGLLARYVEGADGSRLLVGAVDAARGTPCDFTLEPGRCLPPAETRAPIPYFADATCVSPVARIDASAEAAVAIATSLTSEGCRAGLDLYEIGAKVTAATVYFRNSSNVCTTTSTSSAFHYYHVGARIPLSTFPRGQIRQEGAGPIVARRYVDADGKPLGQAHELWNTEADRACVVAQLKDDVVHCLPAGYGLNLGSFFGDAACTQAAGEFHCPANPAPYIVRLAPGAGCAPDIDIPYFDRVSERGPEVPEGSLYRVPLGSTSCSSQEPRSGTRYYFAGAEIPPSAFAEIALKTE